MRKAKLVPKGRDGPDIKLAGYTVCKFNGFYSNEIYEIEDEPIMTMYDRDKNKGSLVA